MEQSSNTILEMIYWSSHKFLVIQISRIYRFIPNFRKNWLHSCALCLLTLIFKLQLARLNHDLERRSLAQGAQDLILPDLDCITSSFQNHLIQPIYIFRKEHHWTAYTVHERGKQERSRGHCCPWPCYCAHRKCARRVGFLVEGVVEEGCWAFPNGSYLNI